MDELLINGRSAIIEAGYKEHGHTPLRWAAEEGCEAFTRLLIENGADIEAKDSDRRTPLHYAAGYGHEAVARLLAEQGADIEAKDRDRRTPLHWAACNGHEAVVNLLVATGEAEVNAKDNYGRTPLSWAAGNGHEAVVKLLLAMSKVDVDPKDKGGQTPLSWAAKNGHVAVVELLEHAVAIRQKTLAEDHPSRLASPVYLQDTARADVRSTTTNTEDTARTVDVWSTSLASRGTSASDIESTLEKGQDAADCDDNASTYTTQENPENPATTAYIGGFVDVLSREVLDENTDEETMNRLHETLPNLLRGFALGLGGEQNRGVHRQAMAFVASQRKRISDSFRSHYQEKKNRQMMEQLRKQKNMSSHAIVDGWRADDTPAAEDDVPNESSQSQSEEYNSDAERSDYSDTSDAHESNHRDESDYDREPPDLPMYKRVITNSTAYRWLLARLHRELALTRPTHAVSAVIRGRLRSRAENRHISRRSGPPICTMLFQSEWDPLVIISNQEYGEKVTPSEAMERAIAITEGPDEEVEALSCGEYLRRTWPGLGETFVKLMQHVVEVKPGTKCIARFYEGTQLTAWLQPEDRFSLEAVGVSETIVEVGEMFAWLTAAFRPGVGETVSHVIPVVRPAAAGQDDATCTISVKAYVPSVPDYTPQGQCWRDLFRNPVVAHGFPVRRRPGKMPGLEVPLETMAALLHTRRISVFDGKVLIKGFCTALIPTRHSDDRDSLITWHVLFNEDGSRISFADPRVRQAANFIEPGKRLGFADVENARHIIGWCMNVKNYAGTKDATYDVKKTSLGPPNHGCVFDRITITGGKYLTISFSWLIRKKEKPIRSSQTRDYQKLVQWAEEQFVVLFDVEDRRAWLVDGLSALLHLVCASVELDRSKGLKVLIGDSCEQNLHEAKNTHTGRAASKEVLMNEDNWSLTLYHNPPTLEEKISTEIGVDGKPGPPKHTRDMKLNPVQFHQRVDDMYQFLQLIVDHQYNNDDTDGFHVKPRGMQRRLEGSGFTDLAEAQDRICPKKLKLDTIAPGWVDLVRAVRAITLFGSGFGELLTPAPPAQPLGATDVGPTDGLLEGGGSVCSHWATLPKGKDLLAVSIRDMPHNLKDADLTSQRRLVAKDLYWLDAGSTAFGCKCSSDLRSPCDRTQAFVREVTKLAADSSSQSPQSPQSPGLPKDGAVVFSHGLKSTPSGRENLFSDARKQGEQETLSPEPNLQSPGSDDSGPGSSSLTSRTRSKSRRQNLGSSSGALDVPQPSTPRTEIDEDQPSSHDQDLTAGLNDSGPSASARAEKGAIGPAQSRRSSGDHSDVNAIPSSSRGEADRSQADSEREDPILRPAEGEGERTNSNPRGQEEQQTPRVPGNVPTPGPDRGRPKMRFWTNIGAGIPSLVKGRRSGSASAPSSSQNQANQDQAGRDPVWRRAMTKVKRKVLSFMELE
ncbi:hypothetical protein RB594_006580 [Gaeumannomyces avenae]